MEVKHSTSELPKVDMQLDTPMVSQALVMEPYSLNLERLCALGIEDINTRMEELTKGVVDVAKMSTLLSEHCRSLELANVQKLERVHHFIEEFVKSTSENFGRLHENFKEITPLPLQFKNFTEWCHSNFLEAFKKLREDCSKESAYVREGLEHCMKSVKELQIFCSQVEPTLQQVRKSGTPLKSGEVAHLIQKVQELENNVQEHCQVQSKALSSMVRKSDAEMLYKGFLTCEEKMSEQNEKLTTLWHEVEKIHNTLKDTPERQKCEGQPSQVPQGYFSKVRGVFEHIYGELKVMRSDMRALYKECQYGQREYTQSLESRLRALEERFERMHVQPKSVDIPKLDLRTSAKNIEDPEIQMVSRLAKVPPGQPSVWETPEAPSKQPTSTRKVEDNEDGMVIQCRALEQSYQSESTQNAVSTKKYSEHGLQPDSFTDKTVESLKPKWDGEPLTFADFMEEWNFYWSAKKRIVGDDNMLKCF